MKPAAQRRVGRLLVASLWLICLVLIAAPPTRSHAISTLAAERKLSNITAADGTITEIALAGDRVVYVADYDVAGRFDLYSALVSGGAVTRLTAGLPPGEVGELQVASTGVAVFTHTRADNQKTSLYSVPLAGGEPALLGPQYEASSPGSQLIFGVSPAGAGSRLA